jgi:hypothetical protein
MLVVEGGAVGMIMFRTMALSVLWATLRIICDEILEPLKIYTVAAAIATLIVLYNYVNVTDIWIWIVLALPVIASELGKERYLKTPIKDVISKET